MDGVIAELSRDARSRYYGKYRGFVVDNEDPEQRGRLRVTVPAVLGDAVTSWALPCLPFGGLADQGWFAIPEPDSIVWVEFEAGDLHQPIWTGVFWQQGSDVPAEAQKQPPTTRLLKTPSGHVLQFDDEDGAEQIRLFHPKEAEVLIDKDGSITVTDASGGSITMDANAGSIEIKDKNNNKVTLDSSGIKLVDKNGNQLEMAAAGITIKGAKVTIG
jgi:uncharacterized protein involved in type VI secretion and phage assembly